jgi:hypothetical protein
MTDSTRVEMNGVEQYCGLCDGKAKRVKVSDRSAYDVDCPRCGAFRTGYQNENGSRAYRAATIRAVQAANKKGCILDLASRSVYRDTIGRLDAARARAEVDRLDD